MLVDDLREQQFHDTIRETLVFFFIYCILFSISYYIVNLLRKPTEKDDCIDYEDRIAYGVSICLCAFTLATCIGAILLLPLSIIANELIIINPNNFYLKWLNSSLIHGLWNITFLFSNLSLFLFVPFTYFFSEAIGLPGYKKGMQSRVIETCLLISGFIFIILGISYVISSIIDSANQHSVLSIILNISDYHFPFLYSCISFIGVLFLLACTPLGLARLFTVVSQMIKEKTFSKDLKEQLDVKRLEEAYMQQHIEDLSTKDTYNSKLDEYYEKLKEIKKIRKQLDDQCNRSRVFRNLLYPILMLIMLLLTVISILVVIKNTFFVIFGKLPTKSFDSDKLGTKSLYKLGFVQIAFDIILISYFMIASLYGLYNIPLFKKILPNYKSTQMRLIKLNCIIFLIFSSALPVSSKILGLTNFDLLGRFGDISWLSNTNIIFFYNVIFAICTITCLITKFTATVRSELYNRVLILFQISLNNSIFINTTYPASATSSRD